MAADGAAALRAWQDDPDAVSKREVTLAVRHTLSLLERLVLERSVEVRVPPAGAVQVGPGHRRGTPPAVVEMPPDTWLKLCTGELSWESADAEGLLDASGERSNLSQFLPLY